MISIDYQSRTPIYEQIVEKFELLIIRGVFPPGTQMPSVRSLSVSLAINPNTIQKAYNALEQKGYIFSVKGRGSFVADNTAAVTHKQKQVEQELKELLMHAKETGLSKEACVHLIEEVYRSSGEEESHT